MQEKRNHVRVPCEIPVICIRKDGGTVAAIATNISLTGMFLVSSERPVLNSPVEVRLRLPGASAESTLPAMVRWIAPDGFGVQFGLLGARETHLIADLVRK